MAKETTIAQRAGVSPRTMNFANPSAGRGIDRVWNAVNNRAQSLYSQARTREQGRRVEQALVRMRRRMRNIE